jgi:hypothetical protein
MWLFKIRDRSLFMEEGRGIFSFLIFKIESPPLKRAEI